MKIEFHTIEDAPEAVKPNLQQLKKAYGVVPNLFAGLAASPATAKSYMDIAANMKEHGILNPVEQQVVYISVSAQNGCDYCVAAHSTGAGKAKMPADVLAALRAQEALPDVKLDALRTFTLAMLDQQGYMSDEDLAAFTMAGYGQAHVLEVITIMAHKTMSNYFNHIAKTPLDGMFKPQEWRTTTR